MASYQSVDVEVVDKNAPSSPIEGVLVRVFSEDGSQFFTQGTTDVEGHVGFTLFTARYSLRFYKFQVSFRQPQLIDVLEGTNGGPPAAGNVFGVEAELVVPPVATDPRLCRASGYFRDITGAPQRYLDLIFIGQFAPVLLEGAGVLSERRAIRTDEQGFACIDLIRCAIYTATVEGSENTLREVKVPDSSNVNLPDLLFPVVGSISLSPSSPFSLAVGDTLDVTPTVLGTNKVPLSGTAVSDVRWSTEDPSIAVVAPTNDKLVLRGVAAGSTRLLAERINTSIIRIPETPIQGSGANITVI